MPRHQIHLQHQFSSSVETVFDYFADHARFGRLWPSQIRRIKDGDSEINGVGSVREIVQGPVRFEETIVNYQRASCIEYRITQGSPLKNHHGCIRFVALEDGGCALDYRIVFDGRFPLIGALVARQLPKDFAAGLARVRSELP